MAKNKGADLGDGVAEVNLTPMIDVTFQLLIFFMVTSEMAKLDNIKNLHLPKADAATPEHNPPVDRLTINIVAKGESDCTFIVGGEPKTREELESLIYREALAKKGQDGFSSRPVVIRASKDVPYKHIQRLMNMLMDEQIWKLTFAAAPKTGEEEGGEGDAPPE